MPVLESTDPQIQDNPVPTFPQEKPPPETHVPGTAFTRALIEESTTGRLVGNVERNFGAQPSMVAQPGYNPVEDIPARHLADGHEYLHLDNPAQVAAKNAELDHRDANLGIIARTGKWGVAASMAVGLVDPLNVASMALIPEAAPTRAGNALRWALTNAGVSGTQELLEGAMGYPETPGEGALNIGASAVLGGLLGPLAPRIPKAKLAAMEETLHEELHSPFKESWIESDTRSANNGKQIIRATADNKHGGEAVLDLAVRDDSLRVHWADNQMRPLGASTGAGVMTDLYRKGIQEAGERGLPFTSDDSVTVSAARIWGRLKEQGFAIEKNPTAELRDTGVGEKRWMTDDGSPVFRVNGVTNPVSKVLGPIQRSVIEDAENDLQPEIEAGYKGGIEPEVPGEEKRPLTYVPPKPEGPTLPRPGMTPEIEPHRMSLGEAIAVTKGAEAKSYGLSYNEAIAQGLDPADLDAAKFGGRRMFTKGGASFDEMAQMLSQHGYPVVDETGAYSPNALLDALDMELRGRKQYSPAAEDYLTALEEHAKASEAADRGQLEPTEREKEMEREAAGVEERQAELQKIRQEAHALPGEPLFEPEEPEEIKPAVVNPEAESTMGARQVGQRTKEDLDIARGGRAYSKTVGIMAPGAKLMASPSTKVRQLTMELGNVYGRVEGNYRDMASPEPIERMLWREIEAKEAAGIAHESQMYREYVDRVKEAGEAPLSRQEFSEEIGKAQHRNDQHQIPEVAKHAAWDRANIKDPWHQRAIQAGLLKDFPPLFAESYQTTLFNLPKIRANKAQWIEFLRKEFIGKGVDPAEATGIAYDTTRNVGASERGMLDMHAYDGLVPKSGRLKARTLDIDHAKLADAGWLVNDMGQLRHAYLRTMVPEVLMTERFGTRDLSDQFQGIADEYAHLSEQARAQGDNARLGYLDRAQRTEVKLLQYVRDSLYGNYGVPKDPGHFMVRAGRFMRAFNIPRMLGGATFKHFPDLANAIQQYGAGNTFATMAKLATSLDAMKLGYREAKRMSVALDWANSVPAALWDAGSHSQFPEQRVMRRVNRAFTIATGETPLITGIQTLAAIMGHDGILRTARRVAAGQLPNKNVMAQLASAGLDRAMLERIATANERHGREINGIKFGMSEQWSDKDAAHAFESAVARDAHGVTMRPGILDKPTFMSKEWGKFIFQFKSFEFAASRVVGLQMLQGLAHGDVRAMSGLLAQFAMATAGYVAYQKATGQKVELNPKKLAVELLDRTNLLGWTNSVIFPALYHAGFKDMTRWYDKDPISALGPSVELGKDLLERQQPARLMGRAPFRRSDLHFMRRMMPANQIWYARRTLDNLEDALGNQFNLPGKSLAERREELENEPTIQ